MDQAIQRMAALLPDGHTIERDAEIVSHCLKLLVLGIFKPGQDRIAREEIHPAIQGLWHINSEFERALHHGRSGVRSENVCPKFCPGILAADVHDETDRFAAFRGILSRETEDHVERGPYARLS